MPQGKVKMRKKKQTIKLKDHIVSYMIEALHHWITLTQYFVDTENLNKKTKRN